MAQWLKSVRMQMIFNYSAWTLLPVGLVFVLALIIGPQEIATQPTIGILFKVLGGVFGLAAVLGLEILYWGMMVFCVVGDRSTTIKKVLWIVAFLTVNLLATFVYFFGVYKKQVQADDQGLASTV